MYIQLIKDVALLIALGSLDGRLTRLRMKNGVWTRLLSGVLFGGVAVAGMALSFQLQSGIMYDGRSIVLTLAGLFGGTISTVIASVLACTYRALIGGDGVWAGLASIVVPALIGLGVRRACGGNPERLGIPALYGVGIAAHVLMLACQLLIVPWPTGLDVIRRIWLPVMVVFPVATVLMTLSLQSERKRVLAESAQRESEDRFRHVFESANVGKSITLTDGKMQPNRAFCDLLGYTREELETRRWQDVTPPEDVPEVQRRLDALTRGERDAERFEKRYVRKDGSIVWADVSVALRRGPDGTPLHFISTVVDISAHRAADEELRESGSRYRTLFGESPVAIWEESFAEVKTRFDELRRAGVTDLRAYLDAHPEEISACAAHVRVLEVNQRSIELFGAASRESLVRDLPAYLPPEANAAFKEELIALFEGKRSFQTEIINLNSRGERILLDVTISVPAEHADDLDSVLVCFIDMTERRRTEERLRQALKMETVGQLAGGIAHDFNNMLQVILGSLEVALGRVEAGSVLENPLREARDAALRSADLTGQLLAFARRQTVNPRVIDLNDAVAESQKMIRRLIGEDIDFVWVPGRELGKVRIDPAQLDQVLANLAVNARDAIGGVGRLSVETANVVLDEAYCATHPGFEPGEYVQFAVSDDGHGMDRETMEHLFEPFFTTKKVGKGTGLGLATVYGIVKQNRGFINAYSEPGQGSTFRVYLPRVRETGAALGADAEGAPEHAANAPPPGGTETLLVVEDEVTILDLVRDSLRYLGYTVLAATSPEEGLRIASEHVGPVDLLVTDVVLPGMNGRKLCERLSVVRPGLPCLFMSGYTANAIAHRGVLEDGVHFIAKPFTLAGLARKVRDALERRAT